MKKKVENNQALINTKYFQSNMISKAEGKKKVLGNGKKERKRAGVPGPLLLN
jgi:hypothetical protein